MNKKSYNKRPSALYLFLNALLALAISPFVKKEVEFPKKIGNYTFYSKLDKKELRKCFSLAVYKNKKGDKAMAKLSPSKVKNYDYYSLRNEINLYKALNNASSRLGKKIPSKFKNICIPKLLDVYEDEKVFISLIEFIEGKVAEDLPEDKKIKLYFRMTEYLAFMGGSLLKNEKNLIIKKGGLSYTILYPVVVLKAVLTNPKNTVDILSSIPDFASCIPAVIRNSKSQLIHRDLHFTNIIILGNKNFLIDFQECIFTEPMYEEITTLRYCWKGCKTGKFSKLLIKQIIKKYSGRENFKKLFQGFSINSVTHGLTAKGFSKGVIDGWIDYLKFAMKPDFSKYEK